MSSPAYSASQMEKGFAPPNYPPPNVSQSNQALYPQQGAVPPQHGQQIIYVTQAPDDDATTQIVMFAVGFCVPITWWVGACCIKANSSNAKTWQTVNRVMTCISVLGLILIIVLNVVAFSIASRNMQNMK